MATKIKNFGIFLLMQVVRENLSNLSVPANSKSFGTGHDKNFSERPSNLATCND